MTVTARRWLAFLSTLAPLVPAAEPGGVAALELTRQGYVRMVLESNLRLAAEREESEVSRLQIAGEEAVFEPEFVGSAYRKRTERENTTEQRQSQGGVSDVFIEREDSYGTGIEGLLPSGARYRLGANLSKTENNLSTWFRPEAYEGEYRTFGGLTLTQPLLRNAGFSAVGAKIKMSVKEAEVAFQELRKELMTLVFRSEGAYWDLVVAQEYLRLRHDSVGIAEKVLQDNRLRVEAGKMSETEVMQAEAGLASRRSQETEANQWLTAALNQARSYLTESVAETERQFRATDRPQPVDVTQDFSQRLLHAFQAHPEYLKQQRLIEEQDIRIAYSENQKWPQVDLVGSYGLNGLGSSPGQAFDDLGRQDFEAWSIGLEMRLPLGGGGKQQTDLAVARLRKRQALMQIKAIETEIANELNTAWRKVTSTREQIGFYQRAVTLNEQLLTTELARLDGGKSDSRKVLELEQDLLESRRAHVQSLVEHQKALAEMEYAEGSLLENREIEPDRSQVPNSKWVKP